MLNALLNDNPGITIFGFKIYAYALCIVSGMIAAFFLISLLFKRRNMSSDLFMTYFCVTLPIAILTTRIFYCITDGMPLREWFSIESIRSGGLSIIGGILGGIFGVALVSYIKKVNFFRAGDCIIVGLLLAQAMGEFRESGSVRGGSDEYGVAMLPVRRVYQQWRQLPRYVYAYLREMVRL